MLLDLLEQHRSLVESWEILAYDQDGPNFRLKAQVIWQDSSVLHIKQIMLGENTFKYAYHWQSKTGELICRWDNAPHWSEIATYPHHKHLMQNQEEIVTHSSGGDLATVFAEITATIKKTL